MSVAGKSIGGALFTPLRDRLTTVSPRRCSSSTRNEPSWPPAPMTSEVFTAAVSSTRLDLRQAITPDAHNLFPAIEADAVEVEHPEIAALAETGDAFAFLPHVAAQLPAIGQCIQAGVFEKGPAPDDQQAD